MLHRAHLAAGHRFDLREADGREQAERVTLDIAWDAKQIVIIMMVSHVFWVLQLGYRFWEYIVSRCIVSLVWPGRPISTTHICKN